VTEHDRDEKAADSGQREHQAGRRPDVVVVDPAHPSGHRHHEAKPKIVQNPK
jgi:hypothetical protein